MIRFPFEMTAFSIILAALLIIQGGHLVHFLMLLAALMIHEGSHWLAIKGFGYRVEAFSLTPLGGELKVDPLFEINPVAEWFIAVSGPLINWLMVAGVIYLRFLGMDNDFLNRWQQYNFLIGFINLIPAMPLDGGRLLHAWLTRHLGLSLAGYWVKVVSGFWAIGFIGFSLVKIIHRQGGLFYLSIGVFIFFHLFAKRSPQFNLFWRLSQRKKKLLLQKGHIPVKTVVVCPNTLLSDVLLTYNLDEYLEILICEHGKVVERVTEDLAWQVLLDQGIKVSFRVLINPRLRGKLAENWRMM